MNMLKTNAKAPAHALFGVKTDGSVMAIDLATGPHWIFAGSTGMGKSVALNSVLVSVVYHTHPAELGILWIDPKMVEAAAYKGLPHSIADPIVDMTEAVAAFDAAVEEMERRYRVFAKVGKKNLVEYHKWIEANPEEAAAAGAEKFQVMIVVVDEWADLVMQDKEVDAPVARLGQKSRAAGIHVIVATQRPSADTLSSRIKANIASRVCMGVVDSMNSLIVLDQTGAEKLNSPGEALVMYKGDITYVKFPFLSDDEIAEAFKQVREKYADFVLPESAKFDYKTLAVNTGKYKWAEAYADDVPVEERKIVKAK